jgi:hypothetical protein
MPHAPKHRRRWLQFYLRMLSAVAFGALPGCVILDKKTAAALMQFQARQIAHSRLMAFAVCCLMALPICVGIGMWWQKKTMTLRSILALVTVECLLLGAFVAIRSYFE